MTAVAPDFFAAPERLPLTDRSRQIDRLRAYYDGTQYDGRPDFFTGTKPGSSDPVPLRERKPCVIYPLPKAACNQATRFTFGDGRFPQIAVGCAEDDEEGALDLDEESASTLTKYLAHVIESSRLKSAMRRLLRIGLSQRSAVAVVRVRRGRFVLDMPRPQDCWPEFVDGDPEGEVLRMVWCYRFDKQVVENDRLVSKPHWFRRDFTADEEIAYLDAEDVPHKPVEWRRDDAKSRRHGLGFCPVHWVRNLPAENCTDIDGVSLIDGLEDELDALNLALSQRHRGIVYFGTPQMTETGVAEDESPGEVARTERPSKTTTARGAKDPYETGGAGARKKAPDTIWSYRNERAKAEAVETTGKAFEATSKHVDDVRNRILEAMDVVLMDSGQIAGKGEISAKALALLFAPLLALVDELRDCWWSTALYPILSLILRITAKLGGKGLLIPCAERVAEICRGFVRPFEDPELGRLELWVPPKMLPSWGAYFSPTNDEIGSLVDATAAAKDAGLIGEATAKRNVAPYFGESETEEDEPESQRASGAASGEDEVHMDGLHMEIFSEERRMLLPGRVMSRLHVEALGQLGDFAVWAVDGPTVRLLDVEFYDGANPGRYVYVPEGEIWIDRQKVSDPVDVAALALHHAIEASVMAEGVAHGPAHEAAHVAECLLRKAFAAGFAEADSSSAALTLAGQWLPGQLAAALGLAKEHAAKKAAPLGAAPAEEDEAPPSERTEKPGEPDPDSTRTPQAGAKPGPSKPRR